jgi:hypothetical protein
MVNRRGTTRQATVTGHRLKWAEAAPPTIPVGGGFGRRAG